jgi:hypothetical protein
MDIFLPAQTRAFLGTTEVVVEIGKSDLPALALNTDISEAREEVTSCAW